MLVIIEAINTPSLWHWGGTVAYLDIYSTAQFDTYDGQAILPGHLALKDAYLRVDCQIQPGNVLYIPAVQLDSTLDSPTNPAARYIAVIRDYRNVIRIMGWPGNLSSWSLTNVASQRWEDIINRNSAQSLGNPSPTYLSQTQTQALIDSALGARNFASDNVVGVTAISWPPTAPNFPIAVSITDPEWLALIAGGGGAEKYLSSYASLQAAVTAIGSEITTLVIDQQPVLTANVTVPANISTRWLGLYAISTGGTWTLTLAGPISANCVPIVDVIADGTTTLSLANNNQVPWLQVEWFGCKGDWGLGLAEAATTNNTLGLRACIAAAKKPDTEFAISDLDNQQNPLEGIQTSCRNILFGGTCAAYRFTSADLNLIDFSEIRQMIVDFNNANIIWDNVSQVSNQVLFNVNRCFRPNFKNLRVTVRDYDYTANTDKTKRLLAAFWIHALPGGSVVSSQGLYDNITIEGLGGYILFPFVIGYLRSLVDDTGQNSENNTFRNINGFDYGEAFCAITQGQARGQEFYAPFGNAGQRGKRGISLYTPYLMNLMGAGGENKIGVQFRMWGGTMTSHTVADFQLAFCQDAVYINGVDSESSARLLTTGFQEVESGLLGKSNITSASNANPCVIGSPDHGFTNGQTVFIVANAGSGAGWSAITGARVITFIDADSYSIPVDTTASGSFGYSALNPNYAILDGLTLQITAGEFYHNGVLIAGLATTNLCTASRDTYVQINSNGTYSYFSLVLGTDPWNPSVFNGTGAVLLKVTSDGTRITSVENYMRGLYIADGGETCPTRLENIRWSSNGMLCKERFAAFNSTLSPAVYSGVRFNNGASADACRIFVKGPANLEFCEFRDDVSNPTNLSAYALFYGNDANTYGPLVARGNTHRKSTGTGEVIVGQSYEGAQLARIEGISSTATFAKNLNGQVTISGTDTTATVTLATAETNANYDIVYGILKGTGAPTISQVSIENQTTTTFDIRLASAPGLGTTVIIKWVLTRSQ